MNVFFISNLISSFYIISTKIKAMSIKLILTLSLLFIALQAITQQCNVSSCQICSIPNVCGLCQKNHLLVKNFQEDKITCQKIQCLDNCDTCYQNNICQKCSQGFYVSSNGECSSAQTSDPNMPPNCLWAYDSLKCQLCSFGFTLQNGQCVQSVQNHLRDSNCKVNQFQNFCQICYPGFMVNFNGRCIIKQKLRLLADYSNCTIANCQTCANTTYCQSCIAGYLPNLNYTCIICNIAGCKTCSDVNKCSQCQTGFNLTSSFICIQCKVQKCANCSGPNICSACNSATLFPSPTGDACFACDKTLANMAGCANCSDTNICGLCLNGYQLLAATGAKGGVCIKCTIENCDSCSLEGTTVVCQTCSLGYSINSGKCVSCQFPCLTCTSTQGPNNCATCQPLLYANQALNGTCVQIQVANCMSPDSTNSSKCATCNSGYVVNTTTGQCDFNCPDYCSSCSSSSSCTGCVDGYTLNANSTCIQCKIKGCKLCQSDVATCSKCVKGFYLISGQCKVCAGFCAACDSNTTCSQLSQSEGQALIVIGNVTVLAKCQDNCITCSNLNPQICLKCQPGNYLKNGKCKKCAGNCLTCNQTDSTKCFWGYPNNFFQSTTCSTCAEKCLTCSSANASANCTSCPPGSYLNNNDCVSGCPKNCYTCSNSTTCTKCLSGYTIYNQSSQLICAPCTTSCRSCAQGKPASCLSCGIGFYLLGTTCKKCVDNCQNCTSAGCISCVDGYFLTSEQSCSLNCQIPCSTCSSSDPKSCTSCIAGYTYNDATKNCSQTICSGACVVCPLGKSISNGQCKICSTSNCRSCNPDNTTQCYTCMPKYYLADDGTCKSCDKSCKTCDTSNGCLRCASGYTRQSTLTATKDGYQCLACQSPCATCLNTPTYCTSCIQGYKFFGWKCAKQFYFEFQLTLQTTLEDFNTHYYDLILAMTETLGDSDPNALTIQNIKRGSVIFKGGAAPSAASGTTNANNQYKALANLLSGSKLAGMPLGASTLNGSGTKGTISKPNETSSSNLGLILGLCIPIGTLLIVGAIILIWRRNKSDKQMDDNQKDGEQNDDDEVSGQSGHAFEYNDKV